MIFIGSCAVILLSVLPSVIHSAVYPPVDNSVENVENSVLAGLFDIYRLLTAGVN